MIDGDVDVDVDGDLDLDIDGNLDGDRDLNLVATFDENGLRFVRNQPSSGADTQGMLSFQRLDVYQRAIEFLSLAIEVVDELPRGLCPSEATS